MVGTKWTDVESALLYSSGALKCIVVWMEVTFSCGQKVDDPMIVVTVMYRCFLVISFLVRV